MSALDQARGLIAADPLARNTRELLLELKPDINEFDYEWIMEGLVRAELTQGLFDEEDDIIGGPDDNQLPQ